MFYKYCVCVCLLFHVSCSRHDDLDYDFEISKATALHSFENNDYEKSIAQFSYLIQQYPEDAVLRHYLAQSYIGRSGVALAKLARCVFKLEKMNNSSFEVVSDMISSLPESSSKSTRSDLSQAVHTVQAFNETYDDEDMRKNEIVYRMLYSVYLVKSIHDKVLEENNLETLTKTPQILNTLIRKNYPELTEIVFQLKGIIQGLDSISGRLKDKFKDYADPEKIKFKIKEKDYSLHWEKEGFERAVENLISEILTDTTKKKSEQT